MIIYRENIFLHETRNKFEHCRNKYILNFQTTTEKMAQSFYVEPS